MTVRDDAVFIAAIAALSRLSQSRDDPGKHRLLPTVLHKNGTPQRSSLVIEKTMTKSDHSSTNGQRYLNGFTLVELLVVIAIIGVLVALLLPSLSSAKEKSRRVACSNNLRQFIIATHLYAGDFAENLPPGNTDYESTSDPPAEDIPVICTNTRNSIIKYAGAWRVLDCPSLGPPFNQPEGWQPEPNYGFVIGYNYLGGHTRTPWERLPGHTGEWISPQKLTDDPSLVLLTDANDWSQGYGKTLAPHGANGPILRGRDFTNASAEGASSASIGAVGGNIGRVDGSVFWKPISQMLIYRGSLKWGEAGCTAAW